MVGNLARSSFQNQSRYGRGNGQTLRTLSQRDSKSTRYTQTIWANMSRICKKDSNQKMQINVCLTTPICTDTLAMIQSGGKCNTQYLCGCIMDFRRCLADEFQPALYDNFIWQRVEILKLYIMFILYVRFLRRNYTIYFNFYSQNHTYTVDRV